MKTDEQRMRDVLVDTIRLLCRTGIDYSRRLRVQGLLGITVDDEHVFLIHVDDFIARNCTDVNDGLCGFADDCNGAGLGHVNYGHRSSVAQNVSENISTEHHSGADAHCSSHWSLNSSTPIDILTSVATSEISAIAAASTEVKDLTSSQLTFNTTSNVPLSENVQPIMVAVTNQTPDQVDGDGDAAAAVVSPAEELCASIKFSVPNDVSADDKGCPPPAFTMDTDAGVEIKVQSTIQPASGISAVANQNQCRPTNMDDLDSSSADTNEDGDSEHTSGSEEVPDGLTVARAFDLVSSLQYDPRALVRNVPRWHDGGADTVAIQPAVLTGVVQSGSSHASTYYQQQVAFYIFCSHTYTLSLVSVPVCSFSCYK